MIIAEIKEKENIIEYIIYIKQLQDIIRANNFDIDKIDELIISKYEVSSQKYDEIKKWYSDIIISMQLEKIEKLGDLKFIKELIEKLNDIHIAMLSDEDNHKHHELYRWAKSNIEDFKKISKHESNNEVEICINALYNLLLLRLQKKDISVETLEAMQTFSNLLANIAYVYKKVIV